jgi:SAM-dependent MidA family methyltransferase
VKSDSHVGGGPLEEIIRREIRARGPMTFARFMELALYHPEHGYYASGRARIGRNGDFFTNVSVGSVFGKLIAAQFLEIWEKLDRPRRFIIAEQGAHDGQFAHDALSALAKSDFFAALSYVIIEPFPVWRKRQQGTLADFREKISWFESIDQLEPFTGVHFSNELFDALPVHLVVAAGNEWKEIFVTSADEQLRFEEGDISSSDLEFALRNLSRATHGSQPRREVSIAGSKLMHQIAEKLSRGVILTIDYGFSRDQFYSAERSTGTLQVRSGHRKLASPFEQIGRADISSHVQWTSLIEAGESVGARKLGLIDQYHFLTGILTQLFPPTDFSAADKRALQTLLHPEMLGRSFQVLALGKNFTGPLSGFRFGRDLS